MRSTTRRNLLAPLAAMSLFAVAACGNDDGVAAGPEAFCAQIEAAEATFDQLDDDAFDPDAFQTAVSAMRAISPPAEIREDWDRLIEGLEAFAEIDFTDPTAFEDFDEEAFADLDEAGDRVNDYVSEECGIDLGA